MSPISIRTDYMMGFVFGVICMGIGIALILWQYLTAGYSFDFSHAYTDPYSIFAGGTSLGTVALAASAILIYHTYQIFIPLKKNTATPASFCPYCGAIVKEEDATICEKCKRQLDSDYSVLTQK